MPFLNAVTELDIDIAEHLDQCCESMPHLVGKPGYIDHIAIDTQAANVMLVSRFEVDIRRPAAKAHRKDQSKHVHRLAAADALGFVRCFVNH